MNEHYFGVDPDKTTSTKLLECIPALQTIINKSSESIERDRQLPSQLLDALHHHSLFRMLLPEEFGGLEVAPAAFLTMIEAIAALDASTAWCLCQGNGCAMAAAFVPDTVATQIWKNDSHAILAWGPGSGQARPIKDGFLLSGRWSFVSGGKHAKWLGGFADVLDEAGQPNLDSKGNPLQRTFLFPSDKAKRHETWNVMGLLGTGSDAFSTESILVPKTHLLARDDQSTRTCSGPLYTFPAISLYATGFAGTALGVARGVLEAFIKTVADKLPHAQTHRLRDNNTIQADVGRSQARLAAAHAFLQHEVTDVWETVLASGILSIGQRMRIRLSATHAIHEAKTVVDTLYDHAGATAIFSSSPFERRFRDIHTISQQIQGRQAHFETVGAFLLGNEPDLRLV